MLESREISASALKWFSRPRRAEWLSLLALLALGSCARDPLAPDCFVPDPEGSGCLIPFPGSSDVAGNCMSGDGAPPEGAVGATYAYDLNDGTIGGTGVYNNWMAVTPLPPGLTLDSATGIISGVPEGPGNMGYPLTVSVDDALTGESYTFDCAEIHINERLNSLAVRNEPNHCIPHTASFEEMLALLGGGDGTDITCSPITDGGLPCPLGDGNGRPAPGITFDAETCTHSGDISGDRRGTWVWMVQIEQSGVETRVPFCASRDVDTFHDITLTANGQQEPDLTPGLLEYDPDMALDFGDKNVGNMIDGTHVWDIVDPACNTDPSQCSNFGFKFDVTCSPFDPPFLIASENADSDTGMRHDLGATGPTPSAEYANDPFVASFEFSYCTSNSGAFCDVDDPNFEQNAQTLYHYDVVAFPIQDNP